MQTLKIENLGNAKSTTRTLKLNETESLHGGLPAEGYIFRDTFNGSDRVVDITGSSPRFTGEVIGNPNANGERGVFAGGQAVALVRADGTVVRGGRDTGFRIINEELGVIEGGSSITDIVTTSGNIVFVG